MTNHCGVSNTTKKIFGILVNDDVRSEWEKCCQTHDLNYSSEAFPRCRADKMLLECWRRTATSLKHRLIARLLYGLVVLFGGRYYGKKKA